jgi:bacteriorhodopsin
VPGVDMFAYHRQLGWLLHAGPIPVLLLAWAAGADRRTIWLCVALLVLVIFQPFLPSMRTDAPFFAALHPVNALGIFGLAAVVALRSLALARQPIHSAAAERPAQATEPLPPH